MAASALLLGMLVLPSCGDSESNIAEEPGTEIDGGENDTIASNFDHEVTQPAPGGDTWRSAGGIPYHIGCRSSACQAEQWYYDAPFRTGNPSAEYGRCQPAARA